MENQVSNPKIGELLRQLEELKRQRALKERKLKKLQRSTKKQNLCEHDKIQLSENSTLNSYKILTGDQPKILSSSKVNNRVSYKNFNCEQGNNYCANKDCENDSLFDSTNTMQNASIYCKKCGMKEKNCFGDDLDKNSQNFSQDFNSQINCNKKSCFSNKNSCQYKKRLSSCENTEDHTECDNKKIKVSLEESEKIQLSCSNVAISHTFSCLAMLQETSNSKFENESMLGIESKKSSLACSEQRLGNNVNCFQSCDDDCSKIFNTSIEAREPCSGQKCCKTDFIQNMNVSSVIKGIKRACIDPKCEQYMSTACPKFCEIPTPVNQNLTPLLRLDKIKSESSVSSDAIPQEGDRITITAVLDYLCHQVEKGKESEFTLPGEFLSLSEKQPKHEENCESDTIHAFELLYQRAKTYPNLEFTLEGEFNYLKVKKCFLSSELSSVLDSHYETPETLTPSSIPESILFNSEKEVNQFIANKSYGADEESEIFKPSSFTTFSSRGSVNEISKNQYSLNSLSKNSHTIPFKEMSNILLLNEEQCIKEQFEAEISDCNVSVKKGFNLMQSKINLLDDKNASLTLTNDVTQYNNLAATDNQVCNSEVLKLLPAVKQSSNKTNELNSNRSLLPSANAIKTSPDFTLANNKCYGRTDSDILSIPETELFPHEQTNEILHEHKSLEGGSPSDKIEGLSESKNRKINFAQVEKIPNVVSISESAYHITGSEQKKPFKRKLWGKKSIGNIFKTDSTKSSGIKCNDNVSSIHLENKVVCNIEENRIVKENHSDTNRINKQLSILFVDSNMKFDSVDKVLNSEEMLPEVANVVDIRMNLEGNSPISSNEANEITSFYKRMDFNDSWQETCPLLEFGKTQKLDFSKNSPNHLENEESKVNEIQCTGLERSQINQERTSHLNFICCLNGEIEEQVSDLHLTLFMERNYSFIQYSAQIQVWRYEKAREWKRVYIHKVDDMFSVVKTCLLKDDKHLALVMLLCREQQYSLQFLFFEKNLKIMKVMEHTNWLQNRSSSDPVLLCGLDGLMFATAYGDENFDVFVHIFSGLDEEPSLTTGKLGSTTTHLKSLCKIKNLPNALMGVSKSNIYIWHILEARLVTAVDLMPQSFLPINSCFWAIAERGLVFFLTTCENNNTDDLCQLLAVNVATGFCQCAQTYNSWPSHKECKISDKSLQAVYCEPFLAVSCNGNCYMWSITEESTMASLKGPSMVTSVAMVESPGGFGLMATGLSTGCIHLYDMISIKI